MARRTKNTPRTARGEAKSPPHLPVFTSWPEVAQGHRARVYPLTACSTILAGRRSQQLERKASGAWASPLRSRSQPSALGWEALVGDAHSWRQKERRIQRRTLCTTRTGKTGRRRPLAAPGFCWCLAEGDQPGSSLKGLFGHGEAPGAVAVERPSPLGRGRCPQCWAQSREDRLVLEKGRDRTKDSRQARLKQREKEMAEATRREVFGEPVRGPLGGFDRCEGLILASN